MLVQFDPEADAIYVKLGDGQGQLRSVELDRRRYLDRDEAGEVVGIEFLFVSEGMDLTDVPHSDEIAAALRSLPRAPAA